MLYLYLSRAFVSKMRPKVVVSLLYAISTYEKRQLKNSHNLKVESYAYSVGLFRTSSPGGGIPSSRDASGRDDFSEPRCLHLSKHRRELNSLT